MITDKKIVLTGADSGIGLEVLKLIAAEKTNTILAVDKNTGNLEKFADCGNVFSLQCDVSSKESVDLIFKTAHETLGGIDIFFANAGYPYYELLDYTDWDRAEAMFRTNVLSPIYSYEKYREYLAGKPGHFAMTVSAIGKMAMPGYTLYSASKFALHGFQQGLRFELPNNIKLTCLYPIATDTNFFKAANPKEFEKPFPVQKPAHVAEKMVEGLERGKKNVNPSKLFTLSSGLFAVCPPVKSVYLALEKGKLKRFVNKNK
ncbi:MAG: SDR family NAD(P)-dependent oxidoreductase [Clostridiales bacterium]|nr:SDR family NAD(P)-dependent oxidoreductase [Clostridiales bacterium]